MHAGLKPAFAQQAIGITGGIGSGKSMVCKVLESLGYPVFYADSAARKVMQEDLQLRQEITALLGPESYVGQEVNRPFIAAAIFGKDESRIALNAIVHPAVWRAFDAWKAQQSHALVFNESALMFETGSYKRFDHTVLVTAPQETRIERVMRRDNLSREEVLARIAKQLPDVEKEKLAGTVITNGPEDLLVPQVLGLIDVLKNGTSSGFLPI
jgi:dephospho-CoA kinase